MPPGDTNAIYSATYSNVPVFEFNVDGNHVMRRRYDDFINATHILKVADYDKPARTRILEREVQKGPHEKIQGGYGKYQGTWIPLADGRALAERNNVLEKLRPIFDYVSGNISPPQAPKHTTNANRARILKPPNAIRKPTKPKAIPAAYSQISEDYDNMSNQLHDDDSQDNETLDSASFIDGDDGYSYPPGSRKRKRLAPQDVLDQQHTMYADALLDYFILSSSEQPALQATQAPLPSNAFEVDRPIDDQGHTALHWGAAMGDIKVVRYFLGRNANIGARNSRGETPLIRAVLFTNNYERDSMSDLVKLLWNTVKDCDNHGANVLHHVVMTNNSHAKRKCARYYLDVLLNRLADICSPDEMYHMINCKDRNGDTPLHIAARHGAKKCVKALIGRGVRTDVSNSRGETSDQLLSSSTSNHQDPLSSSPVLPHADLPGNGEIVRVTKAFSNHYHTESARSFSQSFEPLVQEKTVQVSLALDSELRDKDDDLIDSQRVLEKIENERHTVKQALYPLVAQLTSDDDAELQQLQEEEQQLKLEGMAFSEQLQHKELHHLVRTHEKQIQGAVGRHHLTNGDRINSAEVEAQLEASFELAMEQNKRRKWTVAIVEAQGHAGMSQTGEALKKMVSKMVDVPIDQVPNLIPELLEELEQRKMEVVVGPMSTMV